MRDGLDGSGCQVSSDTRPTGGISLQASLSFHCQYIPSYTLHVPYILHKILYPWSIYTEHKYVYHPPDIVLSKRPKPSMVAVSCDVVCVLLSSLFTIGWNASNPSAPHREDTPDTLLVNVESIFSLMSFLRMSLHI